MRMKEIFLMFMIISCFAFSGIACANKNNLTDLENCSLFNAVYKPQDAYFAKNSQIAFEMIPVKPKPKEVGGSVRNIFFVINAINEMNNEPVSSIRLGDVCSNGISVCKISGEMGQYNEMDNFIPLKSSMSFEVIALSKDFKKLQYDNTIAPYVYILPNSNAAVHVYKSHSKEYVRYYTDEKIYPDFGGIDVWILKDCKGD